LRQTIRAFNQGLVANEASAPGLHPVTTPVCNPEHYGVLPLTWVSRSWSTFASLLPLTWVSRSWPTFASLSPLTWASRS